MDACPEVIIGTLPAKSAPGTPAPDPVMDVLGVSPQLKRPGIVLHHHDTGPQLRTLVCLLDPRKGTCKVRWAVNPIKSNGPSPAQAGVPRALASAICIDDNASFFDSVAGLGDMGLCGASTCWRKFCSAWITRGSSKKIPHMRVQVGSPAVSGTSVSLSALNPEHSWSTCGTVSMGHSKAPSSSRSDQQKKNNLDGGPTSS